MWNVYLSEDGDYYVDHSTGLVDVDDFTGEGGWPVSLDRDALTIVGKFSATQLREGAYLTRGA